MNARPVCIIGNSHIACLKLAHAQPGHPLGDDQVDFFAASANRIGQLQVAEGRYLRTRNRLINKQMRAVSGKERIDVHHYDAFVLVGISFEYRDFIRLFQTHCLYRHAAWKCGRDLISDACFSDWLRDLYVIRPAYRLVRQITAINPGAPVLIAAAPFPVAQSFFAEKQYRDLRSLRGTRYFEEVAALYRDCAGAAARSVGAALSFPGPETLAKAGFTDEHFNRKGVGLAGPKTPDTAWLSEKSRPDPWHMNVDFGRHRLGDIAGWLHQQPGWRAAHGSEPARQAAGGIGREVPAGF